MMHPVYLEVTKDKFQLPVAVADSAYELARMRGVSVTSILHATSRRDKRYPKNSKYQVVFVDDDSVSV